MQLVLSPIHIFQITSIQLGHDIKVKDKSFDYLKNEIIIEIHLEYTSLKDMIIIYNV